MMFNLIYPYLTAKKLGEIFDDFSSKILKKISELAQLISVNYLILANLNQIIGFKWPFYISLDSDSVHSESILAGLKVLLSI
jgi:hypothetical protein